MASTVSTGYLPLAVSAESMTASVPSSTALATSDTSARVGTGLAIIDSIIWVAVIVSLFFSRASRIMRFCRAGTAASPDLDGQVAARHHDRVGGLDDLLQRVDRLRPLDLGDEQRVPAGGAHQLARHDTCPRRSWERTPQGSRPCSAAAVLMSSMSLAVSAGAVKPPP